MKASSSTIHPIIKRERGINNVCDDTYYGDSMITSPKTQRLLIIREELTFVVAILLLRTVFHYYIPGGSASYWFCTTGYMSAITADVAMMVFTS